MSEYSSKSKYKSHTLKSGSGGGGNHRSNSYKYAWRLFSVNKIKKINFKRFILFVYRNNTRSARKYSDSLDNPYETTMAPYQTTVMLDDTRDGQDVVEVQILPQVTIILIQFFFVFYKLQYVCFK